MTIYRCKLDECERVRLDMLMQVKSTLEAVYEDAELCLVNKDCVPLLKRIKARRDKARDELAGFKNYLVINGKAVRV